MSKFFRVDGGDYKITVQNGGVITLDTGNEEGTVVITGDLTVLGNTTTVDTANMTIEDNIILLNRGENNAGVAGGIGNNSSSGIEIDRGSLNNAFMVIDDSVTDSVNGTKGLFVFRLDGGALKGIKTNHVNTAGGDLHLINAGSGVITVTGTVNYEDNVTDDDDITNKRYVDDAISTAFATVFLQQIGDGVLTQSSIVVADEESSGSDSKISFTIDGNVVSELFDDRWEFEKIRLRGNIIETISSNEDLVLSSPGTGSIRIDDNLHISSVPSPGDINQTPLAPSEGIKLYVNNQYTGKTGLYFINAEENRDELVSKNRALLFGMLF